jgi:hypothetical protein
MIVLSLVIFTPFVSGQDLKKATWLERATIIYDQKFSNKITSSVVFQTYNNNEMQFSDQLLEKMASHEEVRLITFMNKGECVLGVKSNEQCILISMDYEMLKSGGGINALQTNGKEIADGLISDVNSAFNLDTEFHSIWIISPGAENVLSELSGSGGLVNAVYTMPKQETGLLFENFSESLILQDIINGGGFYDVAKYLANHPDNTSITVSIIKEYDQYMLLFKVTQVNLTFRTMDISQINPLEDMGFEKIERTKYFQDLFVPLNSVFQVIIVPIEPSKISSVETNVIQELNSVEDVSEKGWYFASTSYDKIDARFLFGMEKNVSADELVMTVKPEISLNDNFSVENIQVNQQNGGEQNGGEQYAVLIVIIVAAIGAALFYLKGYKRNH